jgi:integrase
MTRTRTKFPGVYQRPSERMHNGKPDICYDISYKHEGKKIWEKVGRISEGYSAKLAADIRGERLRSIRHKEELPRQRAKAPLFADIMKKYLDWADKSKKNGKKTDEYLYKGHLMDLDTKRLDQISPFDLEKIKIKSLEKGLAPATVKHILVLVGEAYNKAIVWGFFKGENPVAKVKKPVLQNRRERFLNYDEAENLLTGMGGMSSTVHDISLLSLYTGMRAGEIFNLKGQDLDFENDLIHVSDPKNKHPRKAYMTEGIKAMLLKRRPRTPGEFIFQSKDGGQIKEVSRTFDRVVDQLKLNDGIEDPRQKVVFHSLRHTFASWLALKGETIQTIAELLGHRSLAMTQRYAHLTTDHKRQAVLDLEKAVRQQEKKITRNTNTSTP